jgi:formylglycine-generating enzyme required for sulfatase activity
MTRSLLAPVLLIAMAVTMFVAPARSAPIRNDPEVTIKGSMLCNGACLPDPKPEDHVPVVIAIDGTPAIRAEVARIMAAYYPAKGLDAEAAEKLQSQFTSRLKYYLSTDSPALKDSKFLKQPHYCHPAEASAVTGTVSERDGKRWILATRIEPAKLTYPDRMLAPDRPFAMPSGPPLTLKITGTLSLKCVRIPPGKFLMGTPLYMWPYFVEEYPHVVTLTKPIYLSEIPITQEIYEAVMGSNPSTVKAPTLPVEDVPCPDVRQFCRLLSEKTGRTIRLPTHAEWEYAARVGTSNPGFQEKYRDQNSSGPNGFKAPLPVKSRRPNAWGLYDMASCWWEFVADAFRYNPRIPETDPQFLSPAEGTDQKHAHSGDGIVREGWSIATHESVPSDAKCYAGVKFRIAVEAQP